MQTIPAKHRKLIAEDEYFRKCVICGSLLVQIHHVFIYSGRQIVEMWNYQPVCEKHHHEATPHNVKYKQSTREKVELICLQRANRLALRINYPKFDWLQLYKYLCLKLT